MMEPFPARSRINPVYRFFIGPRRFSRRSFVALIAQYCPARLRAPAVGVFPLRLPARLRAPLSRCLPSSLVASSSLLSPGSDGALRLAGGGSAVGAELGGEGR